MIHDRFIATVVFALGVVATAGLVLSDHYPQAARPEAEGLSALTQVFDNDAGSDPKVPQ